jgi:hypothetical protein
MMSTDNVYGTFCAEPSSEDGWDDMDLTPQEQFDILFGYAEERHIERGARHDDNNERDYSYADGYER